MISELLSCPVLQQVAEVGPTAWPPVSKSLGFGRLSHALLQENTAPWKDILDKEQEAFGLGLLLPCSMLVKE